jgi:8-oxo-dGTP pyrophosphatase MutT (NUDIX family)
MLDRVQKELLQVPFDIRGDVSLNEKNRTILLFQEATEEERSRRVATLTNHWREKATFKLLRGWRNELWPIYGRKGELLFSVERAAMGLLGTTRYGVHMTAYVRDEDAPYGLKMWVPRRAANKPTFPNMLDNTAAGGLMTGEEPLECMIRESDEEASLGEDVVRPRIKNVGTVTYIYVTEEKYVGEGDFIYPECEWVYDLELPVDIIPEPKDGEAQDFRLCDVDEVKRDLAAGNFKSNCAVVVLDFFIRHGILTKENEPHMDEIDRRLHRLIPFPGPHHQSWPQS